MQIAFSCVHCNATLTYNDAHGPVVRYLVSHKVMGVSLDRIIALLIITMVWFFLDLQARRIVVPALGAAVFAYYLLAPYRAYKAVGPCPSDKAATV